LLAGFNTGVAVFFQGSGLCFTHEVAAYGNATSCGIIGASFAWELLSAELLALTDESVSELYDKFPSRSGDSISISDCWDSEPPHSKF
jgi:hypothetical protein